MKISKNPRYEAQTFSESVPNSDCEGIFQRPKPTIIQAIAGMSLLAVLCKP
jgi:hypothetical protein